MRRPGPLAVALLTCAGLVVGGVVGIALGYVFSARTLDVYDQVPLLVSGGIGGIALVVTGCVFGYVQVGRACAERERAVDDELLGRIGALAEVERRRIAATPQKQRTRRTTAPRATT